MDSRCRGYILALYLNNEGLGSPVAIRTHLWRFGLPILRLCFLTRPTDTRKGASSSDSVFEYVAYINSDQLELGSLYHAAVSL